MRRFSIRFLMGLVLALAVGLAALRGANQYWAGGLMVTTPLLLCIALLGAVCGKERSSAGRLGFAVFGGAYFALAFLGLSEGNLAKLPTSKLLWLVHERVAVRGTLAFRVQGVGFQSRFSSGGTFSPNISASPNGATLGIVGESNFDYRAGNRWRAMLPGAAELQSFSAVGHCIFALLAGVLGALIAWRFERGRHNAAAGGRS